MILHSKGEQIKLLAFCIFFKMIDILDPFTVRFWEEVQAEKLSISTNLKHLIITVIPIQPAKLKKVTFSSVTELTVLTAAGGGIRYPYTYKHTLFTNYQNNNEKG